MTFIKNVVFCYKNVSVCNERNPVKILTIPTHVESSGVNRNVLFGALKASITDVLFCSLKPFFILCLDKLGSL